jgi:FkbM family methyltransferase
MTQISENVASTPTKVMSRAKFVSVLSRLYPFYSGSGTVANHPFIQQLAGSKKETVWARVTGGEVLAPLGDFVGRAAFYSGDLDRKVTWICSRLIRPGDTVIDIGANIGIVTVCMANLVGASGHVHSFEPNPSLAQLLREVIRHNQLNNVTLHPIALGQGSGDLELRIPRSNAGAASLVRNSDSPDCRVVTVPVQSLSAVAAQESISSVRIIKIDVEGYETEVLRGARGLLQSVRPDAILFELNDHHNGAACEHPLVKLLLEYEYALLAIPRCMVRMRLNPVDLVEGKLIGNDFLAVARGNELQDILTRVNAGSNFRSAPAN